MNNEEEELSEEKEQRYYCYCFYWCFRVEEIDHESFSD
jgi:hypothetical protein